MKHGTSIFNSAARNSASQAARQLSSMQGDLRSLRDNMDGLQRAIKAAKIPTGPRYIKGSHSKPSIYEAAFGRALGRMLGQDLTMVAGFSVSGGSFYRSGNQWASQWLGLLVKGERIS